MTLDEIKSFCIDLEEVKSVKSQYSYMVKQLNPFCITFTGKDNVDYIQDFDKYGAPIGAPLPFEYDEFTIDLDDIGDFGLNT